MKKYVLKVLFCLVIVSMGTALELTVPEFDFSLLVGKPSTAKKIDITQISSVNFRLLHGERFYSDLGFSIHIPNILHFFHPRPEARSLGQFAFLNFSLNFPRLGGIPMSLSLFTGHHPSLAGTQYIKDFFKYTLQPVRMAECDLAACFLPCDGWEGVGISFAGLTGNASYLGTSFGWNAALKERQEYGMYIQGGSLSSNIVLTHGFGAFHISDKAKHISLTGSLSLLFNIHENFSIYTQAGLHKTDLRSSAIKKDILHNLFVFFEPRISLYRMNFDFTFFASSIREQRIMNFFPAAPLIKPFLFNRNDLFGGVNLFFGFGSMEVDNLQGGFHVLTAVNINDPKNKSSLLVAVTPFFTVDAGPCTFDFRVGIFPMLYKQPASMFEGKIAVKRSL